MWWTLGGTLFLVITLLVKSPNKVWNDFTWNLSLSLNKKNSAEFVFTDLENFTGWSNKGFVVLLGFLQVSDALFIYSQYNRFDGF